MTKPKIGLCLSGCGVMDGSEIHEAVLTLLAIDQHNGEAVPMAPDVELEVIDHRTNQPVGQRRSVLAESARITRGNIRDIAEIRASDLDALIFPGGYGVAKNLCDFASAGPDCKVHPEVERLILEMIEAKKPLGFICIAPALAARVLQKIGGATVTIGSDQSTAQAIERMGSRHEQCDARNIVVDRGLRVVTTPAYMLARSIAEAQAGIDKLVREVITLCGSTS